MAAPGRMLLLIACGAVLAWFTTNACFVAAPRSESLQHRTGLRTARAAGGLLDVPMKASELVQPDREPNRSMYLFGFVEFAEQLNGRVAMLAFFGIIFLEFFMDKGIFAALGELLGTKLTATL
eukprot:gb/GFBE01036345.1/.p1 GENE.gb/GFBE01036345.1/~~gb/GFBE01036345.1/.p1  ORF type:complete len:123 (+),score=28.54 gb/GFBE01036345.1/:1-369(+)